MNRNNSIDIAKGIGIFLVIWAHTICPLTRHIFVFHMPLFFLLSGYVFKGNKNIKVTLQGKIKSLLIPFAFFFVFQRIGFIIIAIIGGTFNYSYLKPWYPIPPWLVMGPLWFIIGLFIVTMTYSVINKIASDSLKFIICLALSFVGYICFSFQIHLPLHFDSALSMMIFFYIGNMLGKTDIQKIGPAKNWALPGVISLMLFVISLNLYLPHIDVSGNIFEGNFFLNEVLITVGCIMVLINSKLIDYIPTGNTTLAYIGKNSLTVFATHAMLLQAAYLIFPKKTLTYPAGIAISVIILGICLIINIFLQKYFPFVFGKQKLVPVKTSVTG